MEGRGRTMALNTREYAEKLLQEAGVAEDQRKAFLDVLGNEKLAQRLGEDVMMHSDYARSMDELKKQNQNFKVFGFIINSQQ